MKLKSLLTSLSCLFALALSAGIANATLVSREAGVWSIVVDEATGKITLCSATTLSCKVVGVLNTTGLSGNVLISAPIGTATSYYFQVMNKFSRTGFSCSYAGVCTAYNFY